jgi:hypothetical protein
LELLPFFHQICKILSGHVGWCTASPDTILELDTLMMIQTKFGFHWSSTFRGEEIVSGDAVHQPTWPLLLKIEHMVKSQVLGNNSKTVNNIKNLT